MRSPWYVIAIRLLVVVPMHVALGAFCLCVAAGWGWRAAANAWRDNAVICE